MVLDRIISFLRDSIDLEKDAVIKVTKQDTNSEVSGEVDSLAAKEDIVGHLRQPKFLE